MPGKVTRPFLVELLEDTKTDRDTYVMGLFVNNAAPTDAWTIADITEATFGGYARVNVNAWGVAFLNAAFVGESDEVLHVFTCTGAPLTETVYGYFLLDSGGNLVGAELNAAGGTPISAAGVTYPVWPRITLENA